jgi:DNA-binding NarL/FixJ family response regulator
MKMNFEDATKQQLLQIALYEECPIEYKYEAVRELQLRQFNEETMLEDLVKLWGQGLSCFSIAMELGIEENTVKWQLTKYGLWKRRVGA